MAPYNLTDPRPSPYPGMAQRRVALGITQRQLAATCHVSVGYIHHLEAGTYTPTIRIASAIASALDVSLDTVAQWFTKETQTS